MRRFRTIEKHKTPVPVARTLSHDVNRRKLIKPALTTLRFFRVFGVFRGKTLLYLSGSRQSSLLFNSKIGCHWHPRPPPPHFSIATPHLVAWHQQTAKMKCALRAVWPPWPTNRSNPCFTGVSIGFHQVSKRNYLATHSSEPEIGFIAIEYPQPAPKHAGAVPGSPDPARKHDRRSPSPRKPKMVQRTNHDS